ncbi:nucleoside/nucleotide kinase family protein [Paracoccus zhejiangensis]|uniref:Nucleoside/nucleotide kinase family protein n=1 Tax=Paracoccus zhejiangensis TaxID=1077935 RepID=A0A2H5F3W7_9RHOB|nr:AAA family ATPase [Paracoccus zhejiangensis]AUH66235.1 nucleoside/nucleotide kinase family protein [Paracoccus zhejiangensis]
MPGPRSVVALAGAPGSGKSTLAEALVARLPGAVLLPMDGFHLDDRVLDARGLRARKGAPETFDAAGFVALLGRVRAGGEVVFPIFDRSREIAIAGAGVIAAETRLVVVEGNYLLLDRDPWRAASYDLTVMLDVPEAELRRRLTARWQGYGADVEAHLQNDMTNALTVIRESRPADLVV